VKPEEQSAMLMSFVFFFFVLSGYFVLRPIRDAVAAASGVQQLPWLFAGTLTATLLFNPIFTSLVVKFPARKFVPIMFQVFVSNLIIFYVMMRFVSPGENSPIDIWAGRAFYVWTSVLAFFGTSIFGASWPTSFGVIRPSACSASSALEARLAPSPAPPLRRRSRQSSGR
jgi:AAA family ATP:ADP antiporter